MKVTNKIFRGHLKIKSVCITIAVVILFVTQSAGAQTYPTKPIEIVHPYAAGTGGDLVARVIADIGQKYLGQPIVVTNKAGASGSSGMGEVITSKPDGYRLLSLVHHYYAATAHMQKLPFDPYDMVPLAVFVEQYQAMGVRAESPFKTWKDLLEYARKNPGMLKWSHGGRGITSHVIPMAIFKKESVTTIDVPYKGGIVEALPAALGGHVDMVSLTGPFSELVKSGKLRLLMVYGEKRLAEFPNVPTNVELGYKNVHLPAFNGIYCHKKTPEPIKKILMDAFKKVYNDPDFAKRVIPLDMIPRWGGPDFVMEEIKKSEAISVPILKELGMYVN